MNSSEPGSTAMRPAGVPAIDWVCQSGKVDLVLQDVATKLKRRRRKRLGASGAALGLGLAAFTFLWLVPFLNETGSMDSPAARRESLALADGSRAELNARTQIETDFRYGRRIVRLDQGEAFFSVVKDPVHPFLVETPGGTVTVTGTKFNVRLASDDRPEVTLLEGRVAFQGPNGSVAALTPGQQYDPVDSQVHTLTAGQLASVTAWREGRLVLEGLTLGEAAAKMAAYHEVSIEVAPSVRSYRMGGSCSLDDLQGFLNFLPKAASVRVVSRGDGASQIVSR